MFFLNRNVNDLVKKQMYKLFSEPKEVSELPVYIYRRFSVSRVDYKGHPVFIIRNRNKRMHSEKAVMYFAFYPLAPKHNVRETLDWLEGVYRAICNRFREDNICFMGDSAGANLALSLAYRMKKKPGKVIAISPAPGLENGESRDIRKKMEPKDPILSVAMNDLVAEYWARNVALNSPDINPAYIDYCCFPDVLILYGTH